MEKSIGKQTLTYNHKINNMKKLIYKILGLGIAVTVLPSSYAAPLGSGELSPISSQTFTATATVEAGSTVLSLSLSGDVALTFGATTPLVRGSRYLTDEAIAAVNGAGADDDVRMLARVTSLTYQASFDAAVLWDIRITHTDGKRGLENDSGSSVLPVKYNYANLGPGLDASDNPIPLNPNNATQWAENFRFVGNSTDDIDPDSDGVGTALFVGSPFLTNNPSEGGSADGAAGTVPFALAVDVPVGALNGAHNSTIEFELVTNVPDRTPTPSE